MKEAEIYINNITWKQFQCDIPGRIIYKETDDGYEIEMLGVKDEDVDRMLETFYTYQSQKGLEEEGKLEGEGK